MCIHNRTETSKIKTTFGTVQPTKSLEFRAALMLFFSLLPLRGTSSSSVCTFKYSSHFCFTPPVGAKLGNVTGVGFGAPELQFSISTSHPRTIDDQRMTPSRGRSKGSLPPTHEFGRVRLSSPVPGNRCLRYSSPDCSCRNDDPPLQVLRVLLASLCRTHGVQSRIRYVCWARHVDIMMR